MPLFHDGAAMFLLIGVGIPAAAFIIYLAVDGFRNILLRRRHRRLRGLNQ
ncbi:MAG: hypothetical protein KJ072_08795 [Verrucomicrobia bacterium]|jgi:hypothetical protein|nr:hypothetical protein [Verrucomicrobiota bacterium]